MRSRANTLLNLGVRYAASPALTLGVDVFNLTGRKANDIEYLYASCTASEVARGECGSGIEGRHVHPMAPRARECEVDVLGAASAGWTSDSMLLTK